MHEGDGGGGEGDGGGGEGDGGGGDGDGGGGLGDGGGGDGEGGGTGQAVWQTYLIWLAQDQSFHLPGTFQLNSRQSSPSKSLGSVCSSSPYQLVYDSGVLDPLHTHVPSDAASVPPIQTLLPAAVASSSAFCSADCTVASCRPAAWQAASASAHERASLMSV